MAIPTVKELEILTRDEVAVLYPEASHLCRTASKLKVFGIDHSGDLWAIHSDETNLAYASYKWDGTAWQPFWKEDADLNF